MSSSNRKNSLSTRSAPDPVLRNPALRESGNPAAVGLASFQAIHAPIAKDIRLEWVSKNSTLGCGELAVDRIGGSAIPYG